MRHTSAHVLPTLVFLASFALPAEAQRSRGRGGSGDTPPVDLSDSALVATISVRSIGPAVMSGRISDIAVASSPRVRGGSLGTVIYIAAATGGVWKSTSGGVTWAPILDDAGVGSMGAVAVAPSNSDIVWAGSGEPQNMRSSSYGDGVYRSVDGGESFRHMGLRTSQHVGRIVIHPENPNIVYVAAVGPLWASGGERGLFRTSDGGETWENVLAIDEHTGVTDLVMDPTDPNVLYAATLQRQRRAYSYIGGGTGSGIHKSTDGGDTWTELTNGLPTSDMGRIGLAVSLSQPRTLYVVVEGSEQGVYRTDDGGDVWRMTSDIASIPWFFGQIRVDPNDPEVVYHLGQRLQRSEDGGVTFERAANSVLIDDLLPLEYLAEAKDSGVPFLFPVAPTLSFRPDGSRSSGTSADRNYRAPNPPVGASISFLMPEVPGDGRATLEIVGRSGDVVRKLEVPKEGGLHHVAWDLRVDAPYSGPPDPAGGSSGRGGGGAQGGAPAVPGMYTARLTIPGGQDGPTVLERPFRVMKDRNVTLTDADLEELFDIRMRHLRLAARNQMALRAADAVQEQVSQATDAMDQIDAPESLKDQAEAVGDDIRDVIRLLRGPGGRGGRGGGGGGGDEADEGPRSVQQRLQTAAGVHRATAMPTRQEMDALRSVPGDLDREVKRINEILTERLPAFFNTLDDAGVPWTLGRPIPAVGG